MKRFVNGVEVEFASDPEASIERLADRLVVRGAEGAQTAVAVRSGDAVLVSYMGRQYRIEKSKSRARSAKGGESGEIYAPMPGAIVEVFVSEGQEVANGEKLLVLEAMKTQQAFTAPFDGKVAAVKAAAGDQVQEGQLLVQIEAPKS